MNRRYFTLGLGAAASVLAIPMSGFARGQSLSDASTDSWQSEQGELSVEWNPSLFQAPAEPSGGNIETVILRADGPKNLLSVWVSLLENSLTAPDEIRDYVENDPDLMYGLDGTDNQRTVVVEDNDAFGVLYRPIYQGRADTWSYEEYLPLADGSGKAINVWLNGNRSKFDRSAIDAAISSVIVNRADMLQAIELEALLDHIEDMNVVTP